MKESSILKKVKELARVYRCAYLRMDPPPYPGVFDALVLFPNGWSCFIETKSSTGPLRKSQEAFEEHLIELGQTYAICNSYETVEATFKAIAAQEKRPVIQLSKGWNHLHLQPSQVNAVNATRGVQDRYYPPHHSV